MDFVAANRLLDDGPGLREMAEEQGYLFVRGLLPEESLWRLRQVILSEAAERGWLDPEAPLLDGIARAGMSTPAHDDPRFTDLQVAVHLLPAFEEVRSHPALLRVLQNLFDGPVQTHCGDVCRMAFPDSFSQTTPPHQDQFFLKSEAETWTAWIPVGDCPRDLGALRVIPASHKAGLMTHGPGSAGTIVEGETPWATADFACGDVLLFQYLTVHAARANLDPRRVRVSVDCRYRRLQGQGGVRSEK